MVERGLSEHRMVPSTDKPETMRFIATVTGSSRWQARRVETGSFIAAL